MYDDFDKVKWIEENVISHYHEIAHDISKWINMRAETEIWVYNRKSQDYS